MRNTDRRSPAKVHIGAWVPKNLLNRISTAARKLKRSRGSLVAEVLAK